MSQSKQQRFRARIYQVGVNRCVDVPERVTRVLGRGKYIPVRGRVENVALRSTLVPRGKSLHRLFIHSRIWRKLGVDTGDTVRVFLLHDEQPQKVTVPDEIAAALRKKSGARETFDSLTVAGRRGFVAWILEARKPETRNHRIQVGIERLIERARKKKKSRG